jgi:hypothetical protein
MVRITGREEVIAVVQELIPPVLGLVHSPAQRRSTVMPYRDPLRGNARRDYYARINENAPRGPDGLIPLGTDEPPPGYTDFYGWHEGRFYGLRGVNGSLLQRFRKEGRWFDEYSDEFPRWDACGRPLTVLLKRPTQHLSLRRVARSQLSTATL